MKKEKFLFELIDQYLYLVSLGCMIMENYLLEDRSDDYADCADRLAQCLDFYDQLYESQESEYSESEINAKLEYIVQALKRETTRKLQAELSNAIKQYIPDADKYIISNFFLNNKGRPQPIDREAVEQFMVRMRSDEKALKGRVGDGEQVRRN